MLFAELPVPVDVKMEPSWKAVLAPEFGKPYFLKLTQFLKSEKQQGQTVYPPGSQIFRAFELTPFPAVRVVILGQDPYHNPGQAHGLSFSVPQGVPPPPSLLNIYKELSTDIPGFVPPQHGNLEGWAAQGVLLLNAILTVRAGAAASHQNQGWENFTDAVIDVINREHQGVVFLLWGSKAQKKGERVDRNRHLVLHAAHPSPLAQNKFTGCRHFSQTNAWLQQQGHPPIQWQV